MSEVMEILYVNESNPNDPMLEYIPVKERNELDVGQTLRGWVRHIGRRYYKITNIDDDQVTKVYLRRIPFHWSDAVALAVMIPLAFFVVKRLIDFFTA